MTHVVMCLLLLHGDHIEGILHDSRGYVSSFTAWWPYWRHIAWLIWSCVFFYCMVTILKAYCMTHMVVCHLLLHGDHIEDILHDSYGRVSSFTARWPYWRHTAWLICSCVFFYCMVTILKAYCMTHMVVWILLLHGDHIECILHDSYGRVSSLTVGVTNLSRCWFQCFPCGQNLALK
jgi:DMSO reductase anchor subunit